MTNFKMQTNISFFLLVITTIYQILLNVDYGSEIWEFEPKDGTTKIHLKAARTLLGLPKIPP